MSIKAVLFDLDGTLVDTRAVEPLRQSRNWKGAVAKLKLTTCFDGVVPALTALSGSGIKIAVVTRSISYYAEAVCRHHGIRYDTLVAYHDARPKPAPDSFLKALQRFGLGQAEAVGVGDDDADATALKAAGIYSIGAGWSSVLDATVGWSKVLKTPSDLVNYVSGKKS